ncbi:MAG: DNA polymerase IV [Robiginitomaculum sp.]|nr:MAG: DNA polymerase IV [Robiginitomaculum sp.]
MSNDSNMHIGICRDCGADVAILSVADIPACGQCRSYRVLYHPELNTLSIAHIDCDAFFASVEKRDNPELANKPVIIGGGTRGVVSAACYNARVFGVHSAMPMFKALKACPQAIVIRPNSDKYGRAGAHVKEIMRDYTPLVQSLSIDEAFLDLTGTERLHHGSPAQTLIKIQKRIFKEVGVTVSVGLSYNKFLAKTASDLDKPNGFAIIGKAEALDFLADKPVGFIFGVGPAFSRTLNKAGIVKISDVRRRSDAQMMKQFGESGLRLAQLARAEDFRPVKVESIRKSISTEITFNTDIGGEDELTDRLWQVCEKTAERAKAKNMAGYVVTMKLKTSHFQTITRRRTLPDPVQLADIIFHTCLPLLKAEIEGVKSGRKFRLIGAGISSLCKPVGDAADLLDPKAQQRRTAERASDKARAKFGNDAVMTGRTLRRKSASQKPNKKD